MLTFGPLTAFNERTSQPLPGTPIQVFTLDGAPVDTFTLDGAPLTLVSNARGYVGMFQADTTERVLVARARGGNDQPVYAHETLDEAADLAETVNDGRLSEAELKSTIDTRTGQLVPPLVTAAIADDDTIRDAAAQAAQDAVGGLALVAVSRHGDDPDEARPAGDVVWWIGSVEPLNAEPHDVWDDSEND